MVYEGNHRLGDLFRSRREKGKPGLPTVSVTLTNGLVDRDSLDRKTDTNLSEAEHLLVKKGDIAYNMMRMWQGASGLAEKDGIVSPAYVVLAPKKNVDSRFAAYLFKSQRLVYLFWAYSYGLTEDRLRLYYGDFAKIAVTVPKVNEQAKIAKILTTWDKAIETTKKLIYNSKVQKKSLMQQLLTGKKRFTVFNCAWQVYKLEDLEKRNLIRLGRGKVISKKDIELNKGDYPIYSSSVKGDGLFGKYGDYMFDCELITWSVDGGGDFFYRKKHKFSVTNVAGFISVDTNNIDYRYLASQLKYQHGKLNFDYQTKAHPSVIRQLYQVALPELEEQKRIGILLQNCDDQIRILEEKVNLLVDEKKALTQQLLTGKRRVRLDCAAQVLP